jgi:hypothetical protein
LRHNGLEASEKLKLFYLSPRSYLALTLDNGETLKKDEKSVLFVLELRYNVITKRGGHIENMQLRALFGLRPPAVPLTFS